MSRNSHGGMSQGLPDPPWDTTKLDEFERNTDHEVTGAPESCCRLATGCGMLFMATYDANARTILLQCAHCGSPAYEILVGTVN